MARNDNNALRNAVAATDAELFASALDNEAAVHDDTNDRSLEQQDDGLEGKVEDLDDETEVETKADADEAEAEVKIDEKADTADDKGPKQDPKTGKFVKADGEDAETAKPDKGLVPPAILRESKDKQRAAEERATTAETKLAESDRRFAELNGKFDLVLRQLEESRKPPAEKKETPQRPDKFADPDGYDKWVEDTIARAVGEVKREAQETQDAYTRRVINMNLAATHEAHGEKFEKAYQTILADAPNNPETRVAIQRIWSSDNPGAELMKWHRNRETLQEVGGDPAAYRKKIADETRAALLADPEFRKEIVASLRAEAGGNNGTGTPRHVTRVPGKTIPSLNGASGSAQLHDPTFDDDSDESAFKYALQNPAS